MRLRFLRSVLTSRFLLPCYTKPTSSIFSFFDLCILRNCRNPCALQYHVIYGIRSRGWILKMKLLNKLCNLSPMTTLIWVVLPLNRRLQRRFVLEIISQLLVSVIWKKKRNRFSLACRHYFLLGIIPSCPYFIWLGLFIKLSDILCLFLSRQYKLLMRTLTSNCCYGKSIEMVPDPPFLIRTCYRRILLVLYQSPSVQNRDIYPCLNSEFMRWVF